LFLICECTYVICTTQIVLNHRKEKEKKKENVGQATKICKNVACEFFYFFSWGDFVPGK